MSAVFHENHYEDYCRQISEIDLFKVKNTLGISVNEGAAVIPFFDDTFFVSGAGIRDKEGKRPGYMICVVLAKYLLMCPQSPKVNEEWSALKDLNSNFTNINVFKSDAERPLIMNFSGRLAALKEAAVRMGCSPVKMDVSYDVSMEIQALPQIKLLLLFNDGDEDFPASSSILYQRHSSDYLDPESLIMTGIAFAKRLKESAEDIGMK